MNTPAMSGHYSHQTLWGLPPACCIDQKFSLSVTHALVVLVTTIGLGCQGSAPVSTASITLPVTITFLYLADSSTTRLEIASDSVVVLRHGAGAKDIKRSAAPKSKQNTGTIDSLCAALSRVPAGDYIRSNIMDGTVITFKSIGYSSKCVNCLHDYIMEQAGIALPRQGVTIQNIRTVTFLANQLIQTTEPPDSTHAEALKGLRSLREIYRERYNRDILFAADTARQGAGTKDAK